ncbi:2,4-diaminobutyric acid acetyltransferase [Nesterenkonia sp. AN1]|uniref:L-2,4-diaminobutyric acid acetyltransferase n=1 Tax=Nesterenkonia aurantiaca TaxID=1436010 RepID=A0A4R7G8D0_9MICC|nr:MULTISPECIES: diaminobutyrate acetyltransferase [Nesterenkonia]EXF24759.1 2,4-diaminobutyric acid acetyltransferase [Nesterenkonia sp. AN1]TDS87736.1 diaminobutyrate acetyltransferase [Nesterenkonia aurantiaca]
MPETADTPAQNSTDASTGSERVEIRTPTVADGTSLWRLAAGTGVLDVNTPYAYILWVRDFAETSVIAEVDGVPAGFISGYRRPSDPETLFIWQVAVDSRFRGRRLASRMLGTLVDSVAPRRLETTITSDNAASIALFTGLARDKGAEITTAALFTEADFPSADESGEVHAAEDLYTVAPLN